MSLSFQDFTGYIQGVVGQTGITKITDPFSNLLSGLSNLPQAFTNIATNIGNGLGSLLSGNGIYLIIGVVIVGGVIVYSGGGSSSRY